MVKRHNAFAAGEQFRACLCQTYAQICHDVPDVLENLTFSVASKTVNDIAWFNALRTTLLIFGVIQKIPVRPQQLPTQVLKITAISPPKDRLPKTIAANGSKSTLSKDILGATHTEIEANEKVLIDGKRPIVG